MAHKLVVGLGNPGRQYAGTRHNIGFEVIAALAGHEEIRVSRRHKAELAEIQVDGRNILLARPLTYMNRSGECVLSLAQKEGLNPASILVIHDELDIGLGTLRCKLGGGDAGHNGLRSISASIGKEYARLRVGIGRPHDGRGITEYVLGRFAPAERPRVEEVVNEAAAVAAAWIEEDMAGAQRALLEIRNRQGGSR